MDIPYARRKGRDIQNLSFILHMVFIVWYVITMCAYNINTTYSRRRTVVNRVDRVHATQDRVREGDGEKQM